MKELPVSFSVAWISGSYYRRLYQPVVPTSKQSTKNNEPVKLHSQGQVHAPHDCGQATRPHGIVYRHDADYTQDICYSCYNHINFRSCTEQICLSRCQATGQENNWKLTKHPTIEHFISHVTSFTTDRDITLLLSRMMFLQKFWKSIGWCDPCESIQCLPC